MQGKCEKDDSARRAEKHIKGVAFRIDKCIAPLLSLLKLSSLPVNRLHSELLVQLNTND